MKTLFLTKSIAEIGAGLLLLFWPHMVTQLFIESQAEGPAIAFVARWCGVAVLVLGILCGIAWRQAETPSAANWAKGFLGYDLAFILLLVISSSLHGALRWPALLAHAALAVWSIVEIRRVRL